MKNLELTLTSHRATGKRRKDRCGIGLGLILTLVFLLPPSSANSENESIIELEQRLQTAKGTPQEPYYLWQLANQYLAENDSIRAAYMFERLRDLPEWPTLPFRRKALLQWALLEEARSRFAIAAELRGEIVSLGRKQNEKLNPAAINDFLMWSDSLLRAGHARKSADALWEIIEQDLAGAGQLAVHRLIDTLYHAEHKNGELNRLTTLVRAQQSINHLLYDIFDLCIERENFDLAGSILDDLITANPLALANRIDSILKMPDSQKRIEQIQTYIDSRQSGSDAITVLRLALYTNLGETDSALQTVREIADRRLRDGATPIPKYLAERMYELFLAAGDDIHAAQLEASMVRQPRPTADWIRRYSQRLAAEGKREEVIQLWEDYVIAHAGLPLRWTEAGQTLQGLGYREEAKKFLQRGHQQSPNLDGTVALADTYLQEKNFATALDILDRLRREGWTDGDWLASHVTEQVQEADSTQLLLDLLLERIKALNISEWQLYLAVDLAARSTADSNAWTKLQESLKSDPSGRLLTLTVSRLLALDRPDLIDLCFPDDGSLAGENNTWPAGIRKELARLLAEDRIDRLPDGKRIVDSLGATIPWDATQAVDYVQLNHEERRLAKLWLDGLVASGNTTQAYAVVSAIEPEKIAEKTPDWGLFESREIIVRCVEIKISAADLLGASQTISAWRRYDDPPRLRWLEGLIHLWQGDVKSCRVQLEYLLNSAPETVEANEAMELVHLLEMTGPEGITQLSQGLYLEMQRRYEDADTPYRDLAIGNRETPVGDWARIKLAKLAWRAGQNEAAKGEWERLLPDTQLHTTAQEARWWLGRWGTTLTPQERYKIWEDVVLEGHDSLIVDMVRQRLDGTP